MRADRIEMLEYDDAWAHRFVEQSDPLSPLFDGFLVRSIEHIGSTAVPGLCAKPIIDMLAVVADIDDVAELDGRLAELAWLHAPEPGDAEQRRRSYCFPTREHRSHHLHVVEEVSTGWRAWLAFRDRLRRDPSTAAEYGALKRGLASTVGHDPNDRVAYRAGKAGLIQRITAEETLTS